MAKFRKRPIAIEAFRMGIDPWPDWFHDKVSEDVIRTYVYEEDENNDPFEFRRTYCAITTLEGVMRGDYGDYIIQGVNGEIYPCKPDIFAQTYESASDDGDEVE